MTVYTQAQAAKRNVTKHDLVRDPKCTLCKLHETADFVCLLGDGPVQCDVMVIGEAPGKREDDSGTPFVGRSGKYLDEVLEDVGLPRKKVFITNAVSCRPPDNRTPSKREIAACSKWLQYQIKRVKPKFILLMGNTPLLAITGATGIKRARGKPFEKDGVTYLPTYHPSYILRGDGRDDAIFRKDLELFKSMVDGGGMPEEKALNIRIVTNEKLFEEMLDDLLGSVSLDIETTGLYPWAKRRPAPDGVKYKKDPPDPRSYDARLVSLGFGTRKYQWIINPQQFKLTPDRLDAITERLEDCIVIGQYAKFDTLWMWVLYGVRWTINFDTGLAHYLLDENTSHGLKDLAQRECDAPNWDVEGETKHEWSPTLIKYHAHDLFYTRQLKFIFEKRLRADPQIRRVFYEILMPCVKIFTEAEYEGIYIDESKMDEVEKILRKDVRVAERKLRKWGDINWGSTKQVGHLLFDKLKIPPTDKTKKGTPSTSEGALKQMDHPLVTDLLKMRGAKQQLSFFIDGWKPYLVNHRIHPSFKLTGTVTGRLSCEHPNLQQVPRDPTIRSLVIAPPGWTLIEADLSQIELRIAAELSGERALIEAFATGQDPHWITALNELRRGHGEQERIMATARKLGKNTNSYDDAVDFLLEQGADACIAVDYAWKELRKKAKAVNFGFLYGMGWKKFKIYAREKYEVILTDQQAQESRDAYFSLYRDLPNWHERQRKYSRRNGYVRMLSGRKRRLPAAMQADRSFECGEAERQAINSPVQGFANELNLMALIELRGELPRRIYRPVGTVHDSILAIGKTEHLKEIAERTLSVMRHPKLLDDFDIQLQIPIDAEVSIGPWGASVGYHKWLKENG